MFSNSDVWEKFCQFFFWQSCHKAKKNRLSSVGGCKQRANYAACCTVSDLSPCPPSPSLSVCVPFSLTLVWQKCESRFVVIHIRATGPASACDAMEVSVASTCTRQRLNVYLEKLWIDLHMCFVEDYFCLFSTGQMKSVPFVKTSLSGLGMCINDVSRDSFF